MRIEKYDVITLSLSLRSHPFLRGPSLESKPPQPSGSPRNCKKIHKKLFKYSTYKHIIIKTSWRSYKLTARTECEGLNSGSFIVSNRLLLYPDEEARDGGSSVSGEETAKQTIQYPLAYMQQQKSLA